MGLGTDLRGALKSLGRMFTNNPEFEVESADDIRGLTHNKKEYEGLKAGSSAADNTASLTVDNNFFGPVVDEEVVKVNGSNRIKTSKKSGSGKGNKYNDLKNKLEVDGLTGIKPNEDIKVVPNRDKGGNTRERFRK